jgi:hypothetical protein
MDVSGQLLMPETYSLDILELRGLFPAWNESTDIIGIIYQYEIWGSTALLVKVPV